MQPKRVRAARARLLDDSAASLVRRIRLIICEPTRAQIVRALGAGPLSVTDLAATVDRSRSVVSQHLRLLREEGLVKTTRRGRRVYYALASDPAACSAAQTLELAARAAS